MGRLKQLLPWNGSTVIETTVNNLRAAGAEPIICVVGYRATELKLVLRNLVVDVVYNEEYRSGEMLSSFQIGLLQLQTGSAKTTSSRGALLALVDQPHIRVHELAAMVDSAQRAPDKIIFPSYNMRRGHPFYLPATLWPELLALGRTETMRTLIRRHPALVDYVTMETDAVLRDMDTPADYEALRDSSA